MKKAKYLFVFLLFAPISKSLAERGACISSGSTPNGKQIFSCLPISRYISNTYYLGRSGLAPDMAKYLLNLKFEDEIKENEVCIRIGIKSLNEWVLNCVNTLSDGTTHPNQQKRDKLCKTSSFGETYTSFSMRQSKAYIFDCEIVKNKKTPVKIHQKKQGKK